MITNYDRPLMTKGKSLNYSRQSFWSLMTKTLMVRSGRMYLCMDRKNIMALTGGGIGFGVIRWVEDS
jgi:hypothetical protein